MTCVIYIHDCCTGDGTPGSRSSNCAHGGLWWILEYGEAGEETLYPALEGATPRLQKNKIQKIKKSSDNN